MEKDQNFSISDKGKGNYIIRTTGTFEPEKYLKDFAFDGKAIEEDDYRYLVENAVMMIYDSMISRKDISLGQMDTVGIWITFDDGLTIDNAMDISILKDMEEYGEEGVIPILEFAKMTLDPYYESSVSE